MPASVYDEPSAQHEQQRAQRLRKTARWILGVGTAVMMALGLVLLFLLTVATNNRQLYEDYYVWLFGLNVLVAGLLLLVLLWMGGRLLQRWQGLTESGPSSRDNPGTQVLPVLPDDVN